MPRLPRGWSLLIFAEVVQVDLDQAQRAAAGGVRRSSRGAAPPRRRGRCRDPCSCPSPRAPGLEVAERVLDRPAPPAARSPRGARLRPRRRTHSPAVSRRRATRPERDDDARPQCLGAVAVPGGEAGVNGVPSGGPSRPTSVRTLPVRLDRRWSPSARRTRRARRRPARWHGRCEGALENLREVERLDRSPSRAAGRRPAGRATALSRSSSPASRLSTSTSVSGRGESLPPAQGKPKRDENAGNANGTQKPQRLPQS